MPECDEDALKARINALETLIDEREDRTKERFASMKIAVDAALAAADRAVTKAEIATEKRFEGVNEFRETLRDQASTLMPRSEYEVQHNTLAEKVISSERRLTLIETTQHGKRDGLVILGYVALGVFAAVTAIGTILGALFFHR